MSERLGVHRWGRVLSELFLRGLGIEGEKVLPDARLRTYVTQLNPAELPSLVRMLRSVSKTIGQVATGFIGVPETERLRGLLKLAGCDLKMLADPTSTSETCRQDFKIKECS
jgi:hypothetical protein